MFSVLKVYRLTVLVLAKFGLSKVTWATCGAVAICTLWRAKFIAAAITVHKEPGPGLLESAYEAFLAHELLTRGFTIERQKPLPVRYRGEVLDLGYRIDLLVENSVIVEVKSVERFHPIHGAQLVSYLRHSRCKVGLVLNFNVKWFVEDGIMRRVNGFPDE